MNRRIDPRQLEQLKALTAANDHTRARVVLSALLKNDRLVAPWAAIEALADFHGYLTPGLKAAWDEMNAILLANLRAEFSAESFLAINGSL